MIEEPDRDETKNQAGTSPEPDVLMKHVQYDDSKNKQEFLHGGQNLASLSNQCQAFIILRWVELSLRREEFKKMKNSILCFVPVGLRPGPVMTVNVVSFDHAIESLSIYGQHTGRGLFVTARVFEDSSNVPSFDL